MHKLMDYVLDMRDMTLDNAHSKNGNYRLTLVI